MAYYALVCTGSVSGSGPSAVCSSGAQGYSGANGVGLPTTDYIWACVDQGAMRSAGDCAGNVTYVSGSSVTLDTWAYTCTATEPAGTACPNGSASWQPAGMYFVGGASATNPSQNSSFDISQLDTVQFGEAFAAAFVIVGMCWALGKAVGMILEMIRR